MSTNEEHKVARKTWLPDTQSSRKPERDRGLIFLLSTFLIVMTIMIVIGITQLNNQKNKREEVRSSLITNTKGLYGVNVTIRRYSPDWASFSIFDGDCVYVADVVRAKNDEWTLVRGTEELDRAKVTIKSDSAEAANCPAKPLSNDLDRLANGG